MAGPADDTDLEARIRRLEQRVGELEGQLATAQPTPSAVPQPVAAQTAAIPAPVPWGPPAAASASAANATIDPSAASAGAGWASTPGWRAPSSGGLLEGVRRFLADLDARLAGRALAWAGGIALVLGAIYFVSLATDRGWIGPDVRIALGTIAGLASLAVGAVVMSRGNRLIGHVLAPLGLAVVSISMVGATRLLDVVPVPLALVVVLASALMAAWIAIRFDAPVVAGFGLIAVLVAPPLLGAPADLATLVFVGSVLVGTTAVALWRAWGWLPPLAFVLSFPQVAVWIGGEPSLAVGLLGSLGYWLLQVVAAGGEAVRRHRIDLPAWSAGLLMGAAAFLVWCGFEVFDGDFAALRPAFLLVVAATHLAIGLAVLQRDGVGSMFGLLSAATGVAALTLAIPVQLDAPLVPVAWSAEAVAVLWVGVERRHRPSRVGAAILFGLAAAALVIDALARDALPIVASASFAIAVGVGAWLLRGSRGAHRLVGGGVVTLGLVAVAHPEPIPSAAMLAATLVAGTLAWIWLDRFGVVRPARYGGLQAPVIGAALLVVGGLAAWFVTALDRFGPDRELTVSVATLVIAGGMLASGIIRREPTAATIAAIAAGATVAYLAPILDPTWLAPLVWSAIALAWQAGVATGRLLEAPARLAAAVLLALGAAWALVVAPPSRLVIGPEPVAVDDAVGAIVALGSVLVGAAVLASWEADARRRAWLWAAIGLGAVYLASIALMDVIGRLIVGPDPDQRRTIGQTALTLLWAGLGIGMFVVGLRARRASWRLAGLGLLAVTTVKVVLVDLSDLDVAYRVVSLIGLGLVLLAGAWIWQRSHDRLDATGPP